MSHERIETVRDSTDDESSKVNEAIAQMRSTIADALETQKNNFSETKTTLYKSTARIDEELGRVNADFNQWKLVMDKDQVSRRDHQEVLTAKIHDMRAAILADQRSMKKQLDDCTRDVHNVLKPFLEDAGVKLGEPEHPASLLRSLAQTCLDWQGEHRKLREKVDKVLTAFNTSEDRMHKISKSHDYMTEHLKTSVGQIKEVYSQVCCVSSEVAAWAKRRRSPEEDEIENTFLASHGIKMSNAFDRPKLDAAMHDFLLELTRQRVQMEGQMSGQLNELQQFVWESSKALVDRQRGYHKVFCFH